MNNLTDEHLPPNNEVEKCKKGTFDKKIIYIIVDSIDLPPAALDPKYLLEENDERTDDLGP